MPEKREPITEKQVNALRSMVGLGAMLMDLYDVDYSVGRRSFGHRSWSIWTRSKHRIDVSISSDGGLVASQSKEPDADWPGVLEQ